MVVQEFRTANQVEKEKKTRGSSVIFAAYWHFRWRRLILHMHMPDLRLVFVCLCEPRGTFNPFCPFPNRSVRMFVLFAWSSNNISLEQHF